MPTSPGTRLSRERAEEVVVTVRSASGSRYSTVAHRKKKEQCSLFKTLISVNFDIVRYCFIDFAEEVSKFLRTAP